MAKHIKLSAEIIERILDRDFYQIIWADVTGDICIDGGSSISIMTRDNAVEQFREGNVLCVLRINPIEQICRNVTDEIAGEIEFERDQAIVAGDTYLPRLSLHANTAGRTM